MKSNPNNKIEQYIEEIYDYLNSCRFVAFSNQTNIIVNKNQIESMLGDLKSRLPEELNKSIMIVQKQNEILQNAESQSNKMMTNAKSQSTKMITSAKATAQAILDNINQQQSELLNKQSELLDKENIVQIATQKGNEIVSEAKQISEDMINNSQFQADNLLKEAQISSNMLMEDSVLQSQKIIDDAVEQANYLKQQANEYVDTLLSNLEILVADYLEETCIKYNGVYNSMDTLLNTIKSNRMELQNTVNEAEEFDDGALSGQMMFNDDTSELQTIEFGGQEIAGESDNTEVGAE